MSANDFAWAFTLAGCAVIVLMDATAARRRAKAAEAARTVEPYLGDVVETPEQAARREAFERWTGQR